MNEITLTVEPDDESGWLVAVWDDPRGGGITTQGKDLRELQDNVCEAVLCHFNDEKPPKKVRLHFIKDPLLVTA